MPGGVAPFGNGAGSAFCLARHLNSLLRELLKQVELKTSATNAAKLQRRELLARARPALGSPEAPALQKLAVSRAAWEPSSELLQSETPRQGVVKRKSFIDVIIAVKTCPSLSAVECRQAAVTLGDGKS